MNRDFGRNAANWKLEQLTVERLGWGGVGIARIPSGKLVILHSPLALFPGEVVEARVDWKRQHGEGQIVRWVKRDARRVQAGCRYAMKCGGCSLWESGECVQELKLMMVNDLLSRELRKSNHIDESVRTDWKWLASPPSVRRSRIQLHYEEGFLGYMEKGSHRIVEVDDCAVADEAIRKAIRIVRKNVRQLVGTDSGRRETQKPRSGDAVRGKREKPVRIELSTGIPACDVYVTSDAKSGAIWRIGGDAGNDGRMVPLKDTDRESASLSYELNGTVIKNHPSGFFQVCPEWAWQAFTTVFLNWDVNGETLFDVYGGCGFFSVLLRKRFKRFTVVESDKNSLEFARANLAAYEADFICEDVDGWLASCCKHGHANDAAQGDAIGGRGMPRRFTRGGAFPSARDVLILDPPRSGLPVSVTESLASVNVRSIILIGCDGAAFCRDAVRLAETRTLKALAAIDLFPMTPQVEMVGLFEKRI